MADNGAAPQDPSAEPIIAPDFIEKIEGLEIESLAKKYGTPLYIYSYETLVGNFRRLRDAFAELNPLLAFSMKCNSNQAVLRALINEGAGLDIVSVGELRRGLAAGVAPAKVVFAGVGKTRAEIAEAITSGIRMFNVESEAEAEAIAAVASKLKRKARIAVRVNPDVDASTHHYISTGKKENKFGIAFDVSRKIFRKLAALPGLEVTGLHCHIGSQILDPTAFQLAVERVDELLRVLRKDGHKIESVNLGGGFGIDYRKGLEPMDVKALAEKITPIIKSWGVSLIFEPGRSVAGSAGFLLTSVEYIKKAETKNFAIVDAAMNDLIRPSLYSAYHRILQVGPKRKGKAPAYDIVGPICESGDFLGKNRELAGLKEGDLLLVCDAGAYGMVMASNYNSRPRAAEVMVKGVKSFVVRKRETVEELIANEVTPEFLKK